MCSGALGWRYALGWSAYLGVSVHIRMCNPSPMEFHMQLYNKGFKKCYGTELSLACLPYFFSNLFAICIRVLKKTGTIRISLYRYRCKDIYVYIYIHMCI